MSDVPPAPPTTWGWSIAAGVLIAIGYYLLPVFGVPERWREYVMPAAAIMGVLGVLTGVARHRPTVRTPWLLLAGALILVMFGDTLTAVGRTAQQTGADAVAGMGYLLQYPLIALALCLFIRRRTPEAQTGALLDAGVVTVATGVLWWNYLFDPITGDRDGTSVERLLRVAYPVLDLLVLAVALLLLLGAGTRTASFRLLLAGVGVLIVADLTRAATDDAGWADEPRIIAYALLAAAALHPSMKWVAQPAPPRAPVASARRMIILTVAGLSPLLVMLVRYARGESVDVPVTAGAAAVLFVIMLVRMRGLVTLQRRLAIVDPMTGLHARDLMVELIRIEADRSERGRGEVAVLVVDADNFRLVNEAYGQPAGDRVLAEMANRVRAACRPGDLLGRDRDDRLIVLLPSVGPRELARLAEDLRERVSVTPIEIGDNSRVRLTVSIGMACLPSDVARSEDLLAFAEQAVRTAKRAGRNRTAGRLGEVHPEMLARQITY